MMCNATHGWLWKGTISQYGATLPNLQFHGVDIKSSSSLYLDFEVNCRHEELLLSAGQRIVGKGANDCQTIQYFWKCILVCISAQNLFCLNRLRSDQQLHHLLSSLAPSWIQIILLSKKSSTLLEYETSQNLFRLVSNLTMLPHKRLLWSVTSMAHLSLSQVLYHACVYPSHESALFTKTLYPGQQCWKTPRKRIPLYWHTL